MEWKEEAKVISSQSNARKEETQALKVFLEDSPNRKAGLQPFPCLLKGLCFWGKEWKIQKLKKPQRSYKSIKISVACSQLEKNTFTAFLMP